MKTEKTPDKFVVMYYTEENLSVIFSGWRGGYLGTDQWNRSSAILKMKDCGDYILAETATSLYTLKKSGLGYTSYTAMLMADMMEHNKLAENPVEIILIEQEEYLENFVRVFKNSVDNTFDVDEEIEAVLKFDFNTLDK